MFTSNYIDSSALLSDRDTTTWQTLVCPLVIALDTCMIRHDNGATTFAIGKCAAQWAAAVSPSRHVEQQRPNASRDKC